MPPEKRVIFFFCNRTILVLRDLCFESMSFCSCLSIIILKLVPFVLLWLSFLRHGFKGTQLLRLRPALILPPRLAMLNYVLNSRVVSSVLTPETQPRWQQASSTNIFRKGWGRQIFIPFKRFNMFSWGLITEYLMLTNFFRGTVLVCLLGNKCTYTAVHTSLITKFCHFFVSV